MGSDTLAGSNTPWLALPRLGSSAELLEIGPVLDELFELPTGSAFTLTKVAADTGRLLTTRWRGTGELGFYPASTIKWVTAAMAVEWMDQHHAAPDTVLQLGDEPAATLRDLLLSMLVMSSNEAFNTLQEAVGFTQTHAAMHSWGVRHSLIRRHFTRPHWNHSRAVRLDTQGHSPQTLAARPAADIPLNPLGDGRKEANYFTTDDLIRVAAATLMGPTRDATHFSLMTQGLSWTNQCYTRQGLTRLTSTRPGRPAFVVLNKPGWWPPDGDHADLCYIRDVHRSEHYLLATYVPGTPEQAQQAMAHAAFAVFSALHDEKTGFHGP